jgi:hypothetical protein
VARLTGTQVAIYAKVSGSFTKILDGYDWEQKTGTQMLRCDIKGDDTERYTASHGEGMVFTCKRRSEGDTKLVEWVIDAAQNNTYSTWRLDMIDNNGSYCQVTCNGYARSSSLKAAVESGIDEDFELQIDDVLTFSH